MFNAFSPLNGGNLGTYAYATESPFDLDAGLDFTRQATGFSAFPFPVVLGYVDGFMPLCDTLEYSLMMGRKPFGPWQGDQSATNAVVFPNIMGSLMKVSG